ncbi:HAMP domain-containing sensor histidine kinase [Haloferula sp. BvORR071]|uniref:sensor histidine kinase n=1 Tax=Haloferula sp. BvORR071 TaxID=1396141 RepID=UPI00069707F2|nr:HAMP domain-containing sensor histidine kinase [Haloferula sp. BvORR071]
MSRRGRTVWLVHGLIVLCAALILGAMAALTRGVVNTERNRASMEMHANEQEQVRLALWRMDAAAANWIADEAQRQVPDPVAKPGDKREVKLRFDAREDGLLLADDPDKVPEFCTAVGLNSKSQAFSAMCSQIPEIPSSWSTPIPPVQADPFQQSEGVSQNQQAVIPQSRASNAYQTFANSKEIADRGKAVKNAVESGKTQFEAWNANSGNNIGFTNVGDWNLLRSSLPRPARFGDELLLLRHLQWKLPSGITSRSIQGAWIDETAMKGLLLGEISDLLPGSILVNSTEADADQGNALASFPWKLKLAQAVEIVPPLPDTIRYPLIAGWCAAVVAILAAWLLVIGLLRLSERRASFVSAVTHELRTPLTTFQLYSDMLASGAVKEEKRGEYFRTLRREAERLSHLVENVLAFSRIERRCGISAPTTRIAGEMVAPMVERFRGRLQEAGMDLSIDPEDKSWETPVKADPAAVEHVLFNLIDNAAKYAARGIVRLDAENNGRGLKIRVSDEGPGIPPKERGRIFHAFHKSAAAAAESRPGVGLGLALSRRLARSGGGNLEFVAGEKGGSSFVLTLPSCGLGVPLL